MKYETWSIDGQIQLQDKVIGSLSGTKSESNKIVTYRSACL